MNPAEREKSPQLYEFPKTPLMAPPEELSLSTEIQRRITGLTHQLDARLEALVAGVIPDGSSSAQLMPKVKSSLRRAVVAQVSACPKQLAGFADRLYVEIQPTCPNVPAETLRQAATRHFGALEAETNGLATEVATINELATRFVEAHMGLVRKIVQSIRAKPSTEEDLWQEGAIALRAAALQFQPDGGAKFGTFAFTAVKNHLLDVVRGSGCSSDYNARRLQEFAFTKETLLQRLGRIPTETEVFDELGWSAKTRKSVSSALALTKPSSLDLNDEESGDVTPSCPGSSPCQTLVKAEELQLLNGALNQLPQDEAAVVNKHYTHRLSLREIAKRDGKSDQEIRQLHQSALERLTQAQPDALAERSRRKGA